MFIFVCDDFMYIFSYELFKWNRLPDFYQWVAVLYQWASYRLKHKTEEDWSRWESSMAGKQKKWVNSK